MARAKPETVRGTPFLTERCPATQSGAKNATSIVRPAFAALLLILGGVSAASAQAVDCAELKARLDALPAAGGGSSLYQRYDEAVAEQRGELSIARQRARDIGCDFALGLGSPQCQAANLKIERMQANLRDLQRKRDALAKEPQARGGSERRAPLEALYARSCTEPADTTRQAASENEGGLFDRLSRGSFEYVSPPEEGGLVIDEPDADSVRAFRTICVRSCDGYYFPMSASSSRDEFARDQENCESICPGTDVRTYYQPSGDYDVGAMMSTATGEPYAELSTAYLYRSPQAPRPPACGCGKVATEQNFSVLAGEGSAAEEVVPAEPVTPYPWPRPDIASDPETLANRDGGLDAKVIVEILKPRLAKRPPAGERKVRVVGPTFLPGQAAAEDPRVPAQKKAQ